MSTQDLPVELGQISGGIQQQQQQPTMSHSPTEKPQPDATVYQELPTTTTAPINHDPSKATARDSPPTQDVIRSDTLPTVIESDEYPTPISSPAPWPPNTTSHPPAPRYSIAVGQGGYYAPDPKTQTSGYYAPTDEKFATGIADVAVPPQAPLMSSGALGAGVGYPPHGLILHQPHDPENQFAAHISASQNRPRERVDCCGGQYAKKTVIILSVLAAVVVIIVIGLGAGLGAQQSQNRRDSF